MSAPKKTWCNLCDRSFTEYERHDCELIRRVERETLERLADQVDGWWASRTPDWIRARIRNIAKDTIQDSRKDDK